VWIYDEPSIKAPCRCRSPSEFEEGLRWQIQWKPFQNSDKFIKPFSRVHVGIRQTDSVDTSRPTSLEGRAAACSNQCLKICCEAVVSRRSNQLLGFDEFSENTHQYSTDPPELVDEKHRVRKAGCDHALWFASRPSE